jgi:hypothetical protein
MGLEGAGGMLEEALAWFVIGAFFNLHGELA